MAVLERDPDIQRVVTVLNQLDPALQNTRVVLIGIGQAAYPDTPVNAAIGKYYFVIADVLNSDFFPDQFSMDFQCSGTGVVQHGVEAAEADDNLVALAQKTADDFL